eukprot:TRINITY_DN5286_c0_g1_i2.p1 TRINITY_DN5286_c0_g1~~TRINITY_DN5286_c0_g1_i2.p1  ORF type:complete len:375 (+),score=83.31 TRINITY_DN5286_c0_g1_i2:103-1125(+)
MGAAVGLVKDPGPVVVATLMAFGGGTLLFAVSLELFADALHHEQSSKAAILEVLAPASLCGGIFFLLLEKLTSAHDIKGKVMQFIHRVQDHVQCFCCRCCCCNYEHGDVDMDTSQLEGSPLGAESSPLLENHAAAEAGQQAPSPDGECETSDKALPTSLHTSLPSAGVSISSLPDASPSLPVSKRKKVEHVGLSIWLGIFVDGIPESLYIGILTLSESGVSIAFIVGVFFSNLPEAMAASVLMRQEGSSRLVILSQWTALCLLTGLGAAAAATAFPSHPTEGQYLFVMGIQGVAAGVMLTMITQTVMPQAYKHSHGTSGVATLIGFLVALVVKVLGMEDF